MFIVSIAIETGQYNTKTVRKPNRTDSGRTVKEANVEQYDTSGRSYLLFKNDFHK